ncbi:iron ABC transporter permease [Brevibacterium sp. BRM-1]|uniref:iron ABC transporter permease n=1 Tax=Brevibacterium sp. BRM-1 TaxID=2999062 RepID=UPI002282AAF6|nr:iron ABC transporter permease [Brevibacterium sp. BRM-1]WAL39383.1 iron ABC transporter permease [Brevibacterium sp. BRM-1]
MPSRAEAPARTGALFAALALALAALSVAHLLQGTSAVSPADLARWALGAGRGDEAGILIDSRLPRLLAGLLVGCALGVSGAILQSVTRNSLASPDTLAVNAGAFLALTACAAFGIALPFFSSAAVAFAGGLATAALVLALSSGPRSSPIQLVLSGSVITLGFSALTSMLLLFFPFQTQSLFAWGAGSLSQAGLGGVVRLLPVCALAIAVVFACGSRLDVLQLGPDAAASLGVRVRPWQAAFIVIAVVLAAVAVTATGPIGFVGLCAPALARMLGRPVPALSRQRTMIGAAALFGALLVVGADVGLRAAFRGLDSVGIPTGVVTSVLGAVAIIVLAQRVRTGFDADSLVTMRAGTRLGLRHPLLLIAATAALLAAAVFASVLAGDTLLLGGDVVNYAHHAASVRIEIILDARLPRVLAALLGGACLALAGAALQAVTRNPLADPGVLGISGGAGLGAVFVLVTVGDSTFWPVFLGASGAAAAVGLLLFGLSARRGLDQARMVLVGVGIAAAAQALTTALIVAADPWNQVMAQTWLAGSTYVATVGQCLPMLASLVLGAVVLASAHRDLDLLQMDEFTPRILGVRVTAARAVLLCTALLLTAATTVTIGVISFVGLVAPHAARLLIGRRNGALLPLAALLGALLVTVADGFGRTIIAPGQIPAGLVTAVLGCPYFLWLLWRMRKDA